MLVNTYILSLQFQSNFIRTDGNLLFHHLNFSPISFIKKMMHLQEFHQDVYQDMSSHGLHAQKKQCSAG